MKLEYKNEQGLLIKEIDEALFSYVNGYAHENEKYNTVKEAMLYSLMAGGKRLRPVLTLQFCKAAGVPYQKAMPFACAVEMIHCYSLIHDDLPCMDDDDMRRGKPSCHKKFGEATALLAGDALLTLAFEAIATAPQKSGVSIEAAIKATGILSSCAGLFGMIGGQVMDLANEGEAINAEILEETYCKKTSMLIIAATLMGLAAGGVADEEKLAKAREYATYLGITFQIVDDILDVTGDEKTLGKPIGSDTQNNKSTYVSLYSLNKARELSAEYTRRAKKALEQTAYNGFLTELTDLLLDRTL